MKRRLALTFALLGSLMVLAAAVQGQILAQSGGRAALVIRFDDERVESRCVAFDEEEISGYTLLQRSGLALDVKPAGQGGLVCAIDGTGCGVDNCLCQCQGDPCVYWSYWRLGEDGWAYSAVGATIRRLSDGDVDGWSWGPGSVTSAIEPPAVTFEQVCTADAQLYGSPAEGQQAAPVNWPVYALFGLLLAVIGLGLLRASRRRQAT